MRKIFLTILIVIVTICSATAGDLILRDYDGIELPVGTLVPVINLREFSTKLDDESARVALISTNDIFMQETKILPKGILFEGFIEKVNEPIVGTNASMIVKITKMTFPDGFVIPMKGYIYSGSGNKLGGGMTDPAVYRTAPHFQEKLGIGTLKYVPGEARKMGEHLTVAAGADLLVVFSSPIWITHILTN